MSEQAKTLKEWRELRGIDQDYLADVVTLTAGERVSSLDIARWEEMGFPVQEEGIEVDRFGSEIVGPLTDILNAHEGIIAHADLDVRRL